MDEERDTWELRRRRIRRKSFEGMASSQIVMLRIMGRVYPARWEWEQAEQEMTLAVEALTEARDLLRTVLQEWEPWTPDTSQSG